MQTFDLEEVSVELTHKSERIEKHGEEEVLACDLDFRWEAPNTQLAMFSPTLRDSLYRREEEQGELLGDDDYKPVLRYPELGTLAWSTPAMEGAELVFHDVKKGKDLAFTGVRVHKFKLTPRGGGTVVVTFQAQVRPTGDEPGILTRLLLAHKVKVSVYKPQEAQTEGEE